MNIPLWANISHKRNSNLSFLSVPKNFLYLRCRTPNFPWAVGPQGKLGKVQINYLKLILVTRLTFSKSFFLAVVYPFLYLPVITDDNQNSKLILVKRR